MKTIAQETLKFLKDLGDHNDRTWFQENKSRYEAAHSNVKEFIADLYTEFQKMDGVDQMKLFRIYRDVRFSKDKTPYKTNFGIGFHRQKPKLRGGYYLNIAPGESFAGGGFWQPNKEDLLRIRQEMAFNAGPMRKIIQAEEFVDRFGELRGEELKTAPKGFDKEHPDIDLIRKKSMTAMASFTDKQVVSDNFGQLVLDTFADLRPWFNYFSEVLTTNVNGESLI